MKYKKIINQVIKHTSTRISRDHKLSTVDNTLLSVIIYDLLIGTGLKNHKENNITVSLGKSSLAFKCNNYQYKKYP